MPTESGLKASPMQCPYHVPPGMSVVMITVAEPAQSIVGAVITGICIPKTVMVVVVVVVHAPPVSEYVIVVDVPVTNEGSNVPAVALVMPVPLHVPPDNVAVRLKGALNIHCGATGVMLMLDALTTVISIVSVVLQIPGVM